MKDRIVRTGEKKPNHRLKTVCLAVSIFALSATSISTALLVNLNSQNNILNNSIKDLKNEIETLEQDNADFKLKYSNR